MAETIKKSINIAYEKTEFRSLSDLYEFQGNLKELYEKDSEKLWKQMVDTGFSDPFKVWNDGKKLNILDGHQRKRVLEMKSRTGHKIPDKFPCDFIKCDSISQAKQRILQYASQYGKITDEGLYEFVIQNEILPDFLQENFTIPDIRMDEFVVGYFENIKGNGSGAKEDNYEPPAEIETDIKTGDIIQLGRHRLMCGDATNKNDVKWLMAEKKVDMVFTDPPYGIDLDTDYSKISGGWISQISYSKSKKYKKIINDDKEFDPCIILSLFKEVKEIFLWGGDYYSKWLPQGGYFVWDKTENQKYTTVGSEFELCWSKQKHKREILPFAWAGCMGLQKEDQKQRIHPTQKPIKLCEWFINKFSKKNNLIVDLFGGSGSTLIACEQTECICFMMEIDPQYCEVICQRWEKLTGKERNKLKS